MSQSAGCLSAGGSCTQRRPLSTSHAGTLDLSITADGDDVQAAVTRKLRVVRTGLADEDLPRIASASVVLDSFSQDMGGAKPWTLYVNNVQAAEVPAGGPVVTSNPDWLFAEGDRYSLDAVLVWNLVIPQ